MSSQRVRLSILAVATISQFFVATPTLANPIGSNVTMGVLWEPSSSNMAELGPTTDSFLANAPISPSMSSNTEVFRLRGGAGFCSNPTDPACVTLGRNVTETQVNSWSQFGSFGLKWAAVLPRCQSTTDLNCIVGMAARSTNTELTVQYKKDFQRGAPFTGDPMLRIPSGGYAPIFTVSGVPETGDSTGKTGSVDLVAKVTVAGQNRAASCVASADATSYWCRNRSKPLITDLGYPDWRLEGFRIEIQRYGTPQSFSTIIGKTPDTKIEFSQPDIGLDLQLSLTVRVESPYIPKGWMNGRLNAPTFSTKPIAGGLELTVAGGTTNVPNPSGTLSCGEYPSLPSLAYRPTTGSRIAYGPRADFDSVWKMITQQAGLPASPTCDQTAITTMIASGQLLTVSPNSYTLGSFLKTTMIGNDALLKLNDPSILGHAAWFAALGDKARKSAQVWSAEYRPSLEELLQVDGSLCDDTGLVGIISTNATIYGRYPVFDPGIGSLTYTIGAAHYLADGQTAFEGRYSLIVSKEYVLCQWGLDPASSNLNVSVSYDAEKQQQAPQTATSFDGTYLTLTATGFTFSAPQVRVKPVEKALRSSRTVRLAPGKSLKITAVAPTTRGVIASWYLLAGGCRMTVAASRVVTMGKSGTCQVMVTRYNTRTLKSSRSIVTLRP